MFISPAYAQSIGGAGGGVEALLPLVLIFVVFYFLLIRPQQKKMKDHKAMLGEIKRGDKIVTGGGIMGTVSKVDDDHLVTVEIAKDVKVKVRRELVSAVLNKTAPASGAANDAGAPKSGGFLSGGLLGSLFGGSKGNAAPAAAPANDAADATTDDAEKAPKKKSPRKSRARKKRAVETSNDSAEAPDTAAPSDTDGASDDAKPANDDK